MTLREAVAWFVANDGSKPLPARTPIWGACWDAADNMLNLVSQALNMPPDDLAKLEIPVTNVVAFAPKD